MEVTIRNSNARKTIIDNLSGGQGPPEDVPFLITIFFELHNITSVSEKKELVHWCEESSEYLSNAELMNYLVSLQRSNTSGTQMMLTNTLDEWKQFVMETYNTSNPSSNPDMENKGKKSAVDTENEGDKSAMDTDDD